MHLCGAQTRSSSRRASIFVNQPAQTVASLHWYWSRIRATLDRWPAVGQRELQAAMRSMTVVMLDELRQDSFKMPSAAKNHRSAA
jgi:hypothetical protein